MDYKVNYNLSASDGRGYGIFSSNLLSGPYYWQTEYEEDSYMISSYDINLIFYVN